jgi:YidC/Oxa1 family membrane protein insertase
MPDRSASPSMGNIIAFVAILILALFVYPWLANKFFPNQQAALPPAVGENEKKPEKPPEQKPANANIADALKRAGPKPADEPVDRSSAAKSETPATGAQARPETAMKAAVPAAPNDDGRRYITLGSVDPDSSKNPYRMGATFTRVGGALARLELSSERYRDLDDRSGYLGHLVMDDSDTGPGCLVQAVVPGTPAARAGIKPGDRIMKVGYRGKDTATDSPDGLELVLRTTEPGNEVEVEVRPAPEAPKNGEPPKKDVQQQKVKRLTVKLMRRPLEVVRPERIQPSVLWVRNGPTDALRLKEDCPLSFLTTLQQVDDDKISADEGPDAKFEDELSAELPGVTLRTALWNIEYPKKGDAANATKVVFSCENSKYHLKFTKTYELVKADGDAAADSDARAYHLVMSLAITNLDSRKHDVAFRQDGPNGLPTEGAWYVTSKVSSAYNAGLRDVVYEFSGFGVGLATCAELSEKADKTEKFRKVIGESSEFSQHPPVFFGVDAQYFSVAMLTDSSSAPAIERAVALRVGGIEEQRRTLTNTTFRLIGKPFALGPGATCQTQRYDIFAGPKRPKLLEAYGLQGLISYGWEIFRMVAVPMTFILEFCYRWVHNYGLAIILLTVVVRLAMHPMSRRQAMNAQRMQALQKKMQPELAELKKKYKSDQEKLHKATMELWQKHGMNPFSTLGGCLLLFVQMPVFMGLYRALQVDIELRDAPLISSAVRWCSNLAAPDMLFDWGHYMPDWVNNGIGMQGIPFFGPMLGLGPYLNLFPIITICLFVVQQKVMMPPAADEQAEATQKMMKYMMIVMGLAFYKVAAGLCIYFIASTFWGLAEKQLLPKARTEDPDADVVPFAKSKPTQPRLTDSEREAIRRQKRKR